MRLYYLDERESARYHVRSALGVDSERWNDLFGDVGAWRQELRKRYDIAPAVELLPFDLLVPREEPGGGGRDGWVSPEEGADIFRGGLRLLEEAACRVGGVELINVCLEKGARGRTDEVSLGRLLTRINTSAAGAGRHAFLIFDQVHEEPITRLYRRLRVHNPIPSRYEVWGTARRPATSPLRASSADQPSAAPGTITCCNWRASSPAPSCSRSRGQGQAGGTSISNTPSPPLTASSTGRRRGETGRGW